VVGVERLTDVDDCTRVYAPHGKPLLCGHEGRDAESERKHAIVCVVYQRILQGGAGWRHDDAKSQWELGYYDLPREQWVTLGAIVTDEFTQRAMEFSQRAFAVKLYCSAGSLPPPLEQYRPPDPPIVMPGY
jgi:hypothetical protein